MLSTGLAEYVVGFADTVTGLAGGPGGIIENTAIGGKGGGGRGPWPGIMGGGPSFMLGWGGPMPCPMPGPMPGPMGPCIGGGGGGGGRLGKRGGPWGPGGR